MSKRWLRTALTGLLLCMPPQMAFAVQPADEANASGRLIVFYQAGALPAKKHALICRRWHSRPRARFRYRGTSTLLACRHHRAGGKTTGRPVACAGEGVSYASPGFPSVNIGDRVDAAPRVKNASGVPVTLGAAAFGALNPADFTKTADACSGTTLNADDTCGVTIRFAPTVVGPRQATLQIPSNMPSMGIGVPVWSSYYTVSNATGSQASSSGGGGGGCAIAGIYVQSDPLLPLLLTMSTVWLARRRRRN